MTDRIFNAPLLIAALVFPISLLGDTSGTVTLKYGSAFDFSAGVAGGSGGDVLWSNGYLTFINGAKGYFILGSGPLNFSLGLADVQAYASDFFGGGIESNELSTDSVFLIETGGGVLARRW